MSWYSFDISRNPLGYCSRLANSFNLTQAAADSRTSTMLGTPESFRHLRMLVTPTIVLSIPLCAKLIAYSSCFRRVLISRRRTLAQDKRWSRIGGPESERRSSSLHIFGAPESFSNHSLPFGQLQHWAVGHADCAT